MTKGAAAQLLAWLPIIAGLAVLYVPSLIDLLSGVWSTDEQKHGPIVLSIACWLAYRKWPDMWQASEGQPTTAWGWPVFIFGLLLYAIGRSQDILLFEVGSVIWVLSAILMLTRGTVALKLQWFALFFMLFMVPLPGAIVDAVTMPMKMAVSYVAEHVLFWVGYQIKQPQGKFVRVIAGEVFDVAVDLRRSSPTFGRWVGEILSADNKRQLWVPPGMAHGFVVLSESAEFLYKTTDYWAPEHERCIAWNDPTLGIQWPTLNGEPLLSGKDAKGQAFLEAEMFG